MTEIFTRDQLDSWNASQSGTIPQATTSGGGGTGSILDGPPSWLGGAGSLLDASPLGGQSKPAGVDASTFMPSVPFASGTFVVAGSGSTLDVKGGATSAGSPVVPGASGGGMDMGLFALIAAGAVALALAVR